MIKVTGVRVNWANRPISSGLYPNKAIKGMEITVIYIPVLLIPGDILRRCFRRIRQQGKGKERRGRRWMDINFHSVRVERPGGLMNTVANETKLSRKPYDRCDKRREKKSTVHAPEENNTF